MTVNPNNIIGVNTTIVGYVATEPRYPAFDKEGKRGLKEISIAHNEGYKKDGEWVKTGTTWYSVMVKDEFLDANPVAKGDKIRVSDAKQEVREFTTKDGETKLGITLSFGDITILESKSPAEEESPF